MTTSIRLSEDVTTPSDRCFTFAVLWPEASPSHPSVGSLDHASITAMHYSTEHPTRLLTKSGTIWTCTCRLQRRRSEIKWYQPKFDCSAKRASLVSHPESHWIEGRDYVTMSCHRGTPSYLASSLQPCMPSQMLRSSNQDQLTVPASSIKLTSRLLLRRLPCGINYQRQCVLQTASPRLSHI